MRINPLLLSSFLVLASFGCAKDAPQETTASKATSAAKQVADPDIVGVAVGAGSFNTLVAALEAADLVATLQSPGPFTVFAPTDEAFANLPPGTVDDLLLPENKDKLTSILTYHVVPGKVLAADVVSLDSAETVQGQSVAISASDAGVRINAASVIQTDVMASNGVIHVIDQVLLPAP